MLVPLLKEQNNLPELFLNSLPEYCSCGFPYEITTTLTDLRCSNPKCPNKIKKRTEALLSDLGITEISPQVVSQFVDKFNAQDPYLIFGYDAEKDGTFGDGTTLEQSKKIQECLQKKNKLTLGDYLIFSNMPNIDSSIRILGKKYNTVEEIFENLTILTLSKDLGYDIENGIINDRVIKVYKTLVTYKSDLIQSSKLINIIPLDSINIIHISCDDDKISGFTNAEDFVAQLNNSQNKYYVEMSRVVYPNTDYYISSHENNINRKRADRLKLPSMTPLEFFKKIKEGL